MPGSLVFSVFSGQTLETSGQSKRTLPASTKKAQPLVQPSDVASQVLFLRTHKGFKKAKGASSRASLYLDNEWWDTAPTVNNFLERTGSTGDQNGSLPRPQVGIRYVTEASSGQSVTVISNVLMPWFTSYSYWSSQLLSHTTRNISDNFPSFETAPKSGGHTFFLIHTFTPLHLLSYSLFLSRLFPTEILKTQS